MTPGADLATLDATGQAALVRGGDASAAELVDAAIARIESLDTELNAVIHPLFDQAREAAKGGLPDGPFTGVPMLMKDIGAMVAGAPFHVGMRALKEAGFTAPVDSVLTQRIRQAGFVICGKTNVPELGLVPTTEPVAYGATKNPWDTGRTPGGSSGGAAAAVASGMVPLAHANDGGGSIRLPASMCGLVGLKPSRGRVTMGPVLGEPNAALVSELAVTRTVRDTAAFLDAVHGPSPGDHYVAQPPTRPYVDELEADPGTLRIGVIAEPLLEDLTLDPVCAEHTRAAAEKLAALGHDVHDGRPGGLDQPGVMQTFTLRWAANVDWTLNQMAAILGRELGPDDLETTTWALAEEGRKHGAADLLEAIHQHQRMTRMLAAWWTEGNDLLLTPTVGEPPPELGTFTPPDGDPMGGFRRSTVTGQYTALFNVTGQPAISVPLGRSEEGLPIGVQLVAAHGREDLLIRVAAQLEREYPWADARPPVHA
ncbi:MAG: amidase [Solirubrobacterales bacterium]